MASRRNRRRRTRRGGGKNKIKPSRYIGHNQGSKDPGCPAGFIDCYICGGKCTMKTEDYGDGYVYKKCSVCKHEVQY